MLRRFLLASLLAAGLGSCFLSTDRSPFLRVTSDVATQYEQRGMVRNSTGVVQSALDLELPTKVEGTLNLGVWTNLDIHNDPGHAWGSRGQGGRFTEIDVTASYAEHYRGLDLEFGVTNFDPTRGPSFPFGPRAGTNEVFASVDKPLGGFTPGVTVHYDFDRVDDLYVDGGVSHLLALRDDLRLESEVRVGWSGEDHSFWYYGVRESGLADLHVRVSTEYDVTEALGVRLRAGGVTILDSGIARGFDANRIDSDNLWMSLGLVWSPFGRPE